MLPSNKYENPEDLSLMDPRSFLKGSWIFLYGILKPLQGSF